MPPQQHVQKPYKVLAEQYVAGMAPPDATVRQGLCVCSGVFPGLTGQPHVHGTGRYYLLKPGDWIIQDVWTPHAWSVIPDAEFQDRFGGNA